MYLLQKTDRLEWEEAQSDGDDRRSDMVSRKVFKRAAGHELLMPSNLVTLTYAHTTSGYIQ